VGSVCSIGSVLWSVSKTPEIPPSEEELAALHASDRGFLTPFLEIIEAIGDMPKVLWQLASSIYSNGTRFFVIGNMCL